ncbi:MAG: SDR family NAD(P)-dependent oxidoreductase [Anaerolineales bacterium]|nr:SDR family NAD(P)-dependent oxidoreductase [Anaerolineales bacterium]
MPVPLHGANAILTGGSLGLGPRFARALAERGVNLVLAARSADKLQAVAGELAGLGVRVVPLAADLTREADRARLAAEAEAALGPIDLLINNAGVEINSRFARKTAAEIDQIITTNVIAPMQLTRLVLPGMLARRRGHIVNLASLAGKLGTPFGSVYGASKAAVLAWSWALRVELEGTGVSVSTLSPGFVTETGLFAYHRTAAHPLLGVSTPADVVRGLLRAVEQAPVEVVVAARPFWLFQALNVFSPGLVMWLNQLTGVRAFLQRIYDKEQP